MNGTIKALIVENEALRRYGLRLTLEQANCEVAEAGNVRELESEACKCNPDVVIVNANMPNLQGVRAIEWLHQWKKSCQLIALAKPNSLIELEILRPVKRISYLTPSVSPDEFIRAVRIVAHGSTIVNQEIAVAFEKLERISAANGLTPRQFQILQLICQGHCNKTVASRLCISVKTVESHRCAIMEKTGSHSSVELVLFALKRGFLEIHPAESQTSLAAA